jgi:PHP family Zn ribbon phosphoesterase
MVTSDPNACSKCGRRNPINFRVEPEEAWRTVVLNRWRIVCPSCFDAEAEKAGVRYNFAELEEQSWSERPAPRSPYKRKR